MATDGSGKRVRVYRLIPALLVCLGSVVGLAPVVVFLGRPRLLLYIAAASVLGVLFDVLRLSRKTVKPSAMSSPGTLEFLLAGMSAVYLPASGGILSLIVFALVYGAAWLLGILIEWLGLEAQIVPGSIAYYPTAVLAVLFGLGSGAGADQLRRRLYPGIAGLKSAFYDLISRARRGLMVYTTGAVFVLGVALTIFLAKGGGAKWFYVFLQVYLAVVSLPLWSAGAPLTRSSSAIDAIEKLFKAAGYDTVPAPRTGDAAIDPLLANVDLIAYSDERAFALQVRAPGRPPRPVDWTAASSLQTAAWTLDSISQELGLTSHKVEPWMVLVGVEPDDSLRAFAEEESVRVVDIPSGDLPQILGAAAERSLLREMARRYLGLSDAEQGAAVDPTVAGVAGGQS